MITYNLKYGRVEGEKGRQEIDANESARFNYWTNRKTMNGTLEYNWFIATLAEPMT